MHSENKKISSENSKTPSLMLECDLRRIHNSQGTALSVFSIMHFSITEGIVS